MPWMGPGRRYYYQRQRVNGHIMYTYYGAGSDVALIAQFDALDRDRRDLERWQGQQDRALLVDLDRKLGALSADLRGLVCAVLEAHGFHQHKRQWRKRRMDVSKEKVLVKPPRANCSS